MSTKQKKEPKYSFEQVMSLFAFKQGDVCTVATNRETGEIFLGKSVDFLIRKIQGGALPDIKPEFTLEEVRKYKEDFDRIAYMEAAFGDNWDVATRTDFHDMGKSQTAILSGGGPYQSFRAALDSMRSDTQRIPVEVLPPAIKDKQ